MKINFSKHLINLWLNVNQRLNFNQLQINIFVNNITFINLSWQYYFKIRNTLSLAKI